MLICFSDIRINHFQNDQTFSLILSFGMFMAAHLSTQTKYLAGQTYIASWEYFLTHPFQSSDLWPETNTTLRAYATLA
jgi:hypothetical protein